MTWLISTWMLLTDMVIASTPTKAASEACISSPSQVTPTNWLAVAGTEARASANSALLRAKPTALGLGVSLSSPATTIWPSLLLSTK